MSLRWKTTVPLLMVVTFCLLVEQVVGQIVPQRVQPQVRSTSNTIQTLPPRQMESAEVPMRRERSSFDQAPTSSFIDSIKGSDASIQVVYGQSRLITTKKPIASAEGVAVIGVADPTVIDFDVLGPQLIRIVGKRIGVTDLSFVTADGETFAYQINVGYDLQLVEAQLKQLYPDALIRLGQLREHIVVEGQARSSFQVNRIIETLRAYAVSMALQQQRKTLLEGGEVPGAGEPNPGAPDAAAASGLQQGLAIGKGQLGWVKSGRHQVQPEIINLLKVPGSQQIMLKVVIAELNRTALREIGADLQITTGSGSFLTYMLGQSGGNIAIFENGDFQASFKALRTNGVTTVLSEPNLVAMNGHMASFLVGGEVGYQLLGTQGAPSSEFRPFGVQLEFTPNILDDGIIRLQVAPTVSSVDRELGDGTVPGFRSRSASTTVELREGQTLALAGLLDKFSSNSTKRIPILGDAPYLSPLFSNASSEQREQELVVLVTPYVVNGMSSDQLGPLPGSEVIPPSDFEFYLLNRIESRLGRSVRPTANWDDPLNLRSHHALERAHVSGPSGFSNSTMQSELSSPSNMPSPPGIPQTEAITQGYR